MGTLPTRSPFRRLAPTILLLTVLLAGMVGPVSAHATVAPPARAAQAAGAGAPAFGSMDAAVAVIPGLAYGGVVPATVAFDGSGSYCLELCSLTSWEWTFGDGGTASGPQVSHTYTTSGLWTVTLTVRSSNGLTGTASTIVNAFSYTQARMTPSTTAGLLPLNVAFDARASVSNWDRPIVSYAWAFGDGATGAGAQVSHVYTTPGVRQVTLTVTDSAGGFQTIGDYIYVQDAMAPPINARATSPTKGAVSLTWTNRMVAVNYLQVERCAGTSCRTFAAVSRVPGTATSFQDSGLRSGTTYRYRIRVTDYLGNTGVSSIVSVKSR